MLLDLQISSKNNLFCSSFTVFFESPKITNYFIQLEIRMHLILEIRSKKLEKYCSLNYYNNKKRSDFSLRKFLIFLMITLCNPPQFLITNY